MDFATMMVIALTVCGVIWALDARLWAPRRRAALAAASAVSTGPLAEQDRQRIAKEPLLVEYASSFFPVILVVLLLRFFLVVWFGFPCGWLMSRLWVGDFFLVIIFSLGFRLPVVILMVIVIG